MSGITRLRMFVVGTLGALLLAPAAAQGSPQNIIVMVGDGMGFEHVAAARAYNGGPLSFESAPFQAQMTTDALDINGNPTLTDSAASATAMATGEKVLSLVISKRIPGDQSDLETSLEFWKDRGKSSGLVTNAFVEDATPAAFGAHTIARLFTNEIADDYLTETRPNVLFGGVEPLIGMTEAKATTAGYTVVQTRDELFALDLSAQTHLSGQFSSGPLPYEYDYAVGNDSGYDTAPFLTEMTSAALSVLETDPDGFFLVIEQENTDSAGHLLLPTADKIERNVFATLELAASVQLVLDWIQAQPDPGETLLLVLADHETGGLQVVTDNGPGQFPTVTWAGDDHTPVPVPVYAWGPNAQLVTGLLDNTDIFHITTIPEPSAASLLALGLGGLAWARPRLRRTS